VISEITLLLLPFIFLWGLWLRFYRKIISEGLAFPGSDYKEEKIKIKPNSSVILQVKGKCTILVNSMTGWATIRINNGAKQKIYKIRLINIDGKLEIINESKIFPLDIIVRCSYLTYE